MNTVKMICGHHYKQYYVAKLMYMPVLTTFVAVMVTTYHKLKKIR